MEPIKFFLDIRELVLPIHVGAAIAGFTLALSSDLIFTYFARDKVLDPGELRKLTLLSRGVWACVILILLTGVAVFLSNPSFYISYGKFMAKMTVVGVIVINGYVLLRAVQPRLNSSFLTSDSDKGVRKLAFSCGAISSISWIAAISIATFDIPWSYGEIILIYLFILLAGIVVSQIVQKKLFETK